MAQYLRTQRSCCKKGSAVPLLGQEGLRRAVADTSKLSAGPVGVGTRYCQTRSVPGKSTESFEVTVFEPASRLAIHGKIGPFQATMRYELEARAGATRVVNNVELDPPRPC